MKSVHTICCVAKVWTSEGQALGPDHRHRSWRSSHGTSSWRCCRVCRRRRGWGCHCHRIRGRNGHRIWTCASCACSNAKHQKDKEERWRKCTNSRLRFFLMLITTSLCIVLYYSAQAHHIGGPPRACLPFQVSPTGGRSELPHSLRPNGHHFGSAKMSQNVKPIEKIVVLNQSNRFFPKMGKRTSKTKN